MTCPTTQASVTTTREIEPLISAFTLVCFRGHGNFVLLSPTTAISDPNPSTNELFLGQQLAVLSEADRALAFWADTRRGNVDTNTQDIGLAVVVCLLAAIAVTGASVSPAAFTAGLTISAVSHYIADRRAPLRWFAAVTGHAAFFDLGAARPGRDDNPCLGTGAYAMDQAWHYGWLFVAALVMA